MQHFFSHFGTTREMRLLRMSLPATPENVPPQEPQPEQSIPVNEAIPLQSHDALETVFKNIEKNLARSQENANMTADEWIASVVSTAQRDVDALSSTPGASGEFVTQYMRQNNMLLHERGLHMSRIDGKVILSPYGTGVRSPDEQARFNRIAELQDQIKQVDLNISLLMRDFSRNAVRYRGQKSTAMNRRNFAPEINKFLMQFPQASMEASASPLHQLYALKFSLQQELAGVKSRLIKVSAPIAGAQEPDIGNGEVGRITPMGTSGEPEGYLYLQNPATSANPLMQEQQSVLAQNPEVPDALQAKILSTTSRWRSCKTDEERETLKGFLMMDGVDVDASDLQKDQIVMVNPEEKGMQFLAGLVMVLKSLLERFSQKRKTVEKADAATEEPSTMTEEERTKEKESNDAKLTKLKDKRKKTQAEMKKVKEKLDDKASPPEGEAKEKLEKELKDMKEELTKIEQEIEKLEERNVALVAPAPTKETAVTRATVWKDMESDTSLQDDTVLQNFRTTKEEVQRNILVSIESLKKDPAACESFLRMLLGTDTTSGSKPSDPNDMKKFLESMKTLLDDMKLETNDTGEYRVRLNVNDVKNDPYKNRIVESIEKRMNDALNTKATEVVSMIEKRKEGGAEQKS